MNIEDRNATLKTFILGDLVDKCGQMLTPNLVDELFEKIFNDVLNVINRVDE